MKTDSGDILHSGTTKITATSLKWQKARFNLDMSILKLKMMIVRVGGITLPTRIGKIHSYIGTYVRITCIWRLVRFR